MRKNWKTQGIFIYEDFSKDSMELKKLLWDKVKVKDKQRILNDEKKLKNTGYLYLRGLFKGRYGT